MKHTQTYKAFTLVELLVAIGIIGLLMAILLPSLAKARRAAEQIRCASNLRQLHMAFVLYTDDHKGTYPCPASDPVRPGIWLWMGRGWRPLLETYVSRGMDPGVFFCPSDLISAEKYDSTSYAYSLSFYHSPDQVNAMTTVASQYSNPQPPVAQKSGSVKYSSQKILAGEWLSVHETCINDNGWFGTGGKRVFVFADGHAEFLEWTSIIPGNDGMPNPNVTRDGIRGIDIQ